MVLFQKNYELQEHEQQLSELSKRNDVSMSPFYRCYQFFINNFYSFLLTILTHWGRVTHICIGNLTIIGSDNGLLPRRRQAIIWTNAGILLIRPLGTNFNEMLIEILTFSFMKMRFKVSSAKWRPFCLCLNVVNQWCPWLKSCHRRLHLCICLSLPLTLAC